MSTDWTAARPAVEERTYTPHSRTTAGTDTSVEWTTDPDTNPTCKRGATEKRGGKSRMGKRKEAGEPKHQERADSEDAPPKRKATKRNAEKHREET